MAATLEEWLMAAEYVMAGGNYDGDPLRAGRADVRRP